MKVKELRISLRRGAITSSGYLVPDDAEIVSQIPDPFVGEDHVVTYESVGAEYDKENNQLIINLE